MANRSRRRVPAVSSVEVLPAVRPVQTVTGIANLLPELPSYLEEPLNDLKDDPSTGKSFKTQFTAEQKADFIRHYVASGGLFLQSCAAISSTAPTVYWHLSQDKDWTRSLKLAKLALGETVMSTSYKRALEPNGVIDRMFQIQKRFFPSAYGDRVQQSGDTNQLNLHFHR